MLIYTNKPYNPSPRPPHTLGNLWSTGTRFHLIPRIPWGDDGSVFFRFRLIYFFTNSLFRMHQMWSRHLPEKKTHDCFVPRQQGFGIQTGREEHDFFVGNGTKTRRGHVSNPDGTRQPFVPLYTPCPTLLVCHSNPVIHGTLFLFSTCPVVRVHV